MMMPRIYKLIIAFGASILFSSIAHAQDDGAPPILDLQLFIQEVQNQYPLLQVADLQTELAEPKLLEKKGAFDLRIGSQYDQKFYSSTNYYSIFNGGASWQSPYAFRLNAGADFAEVTQKYSDDAATKENGGSLGDFIEKNTRDLSPQTTKALFELEEGEYSEPFNIGYALEIVKATERRDEQVKAAHILFNFKNLETFINDRKAEQPSRIYISLPELEDIKAPETEIEAVQQ
jgi:hypothetical protein